MIFGPQPTLGACFLLIIQPTVFTGDSRLSVLVHVRELSQHGLKGIFDIVHSSVENILQVHHRVWEERLHDPLVSSWNIINEMLPLMAPLKGSNELTNMAVGQ